MKLRKIICALLCFLFVLMGCTKTSYERDTSQGEIIEISLQQLKQKMDKKETFAVMLTQSMCGYCKDFEELLAAYIQSHHVIMYNVVLDNEKATPQENLVTIKSYFKNFSSTPSIYYVRDGVNEHQLLASNKEISEHDLNDWIRKHKLDEKREE